MPQGKYKISDIEQPESSGFSSAGTGSFVGDLGQGAASGAASTLLNAYRLIRMVPGVGDKLPAPSQFIESLRTAPDNLAGHIGRIGESIGEFAIPAAATAKVMEGAGLIANAAAQGLVAGDVAGVRSGGDKGQMLDAAALGTAGPVVGAGLAAGARAGANAIANSPKLASALPDVIGLVSPRAGNAARIAAKVVKAGAPEAAPEAAASAESLDPLLSQKDTIAKMSGYKDYASAPKDTKTTIDQVVAARVNDANFKSGPTVAPKAAAPVAAQAAEVPVVAPETPAVQPASVPARPKLTIVPGRPIKPPLKSPAAVPPAAAVEPPSAEVASPASAEGTEPKTELQDLLERSIANPKMKPADLEELNQHLTTEYAKKNAEIGARAEDLHQTRRALEMGKWLMQYGVNPDHIESMTEPEWHQIGKLSLSGDNKVPSAATIQKTIDLMKMGQE